MNLQYEIIKKFSNSQLSHTVHIPNVRTILYVNSTTIFQRVQESATDSNLDVYSEQYLKMLIEQIDSIEQFYGPTATTERDIYKSLENIWTLCHILYFSKFDQTNITLHLMEWYNKGHKSYLHEFDRQSICYNQSTLEHADFWPYTIRLLLLGQTKSVSNLFRHVLSNAGIQPYNHLKRYIEFIHILTSTDIHLIKTREHHIQHVLKELYKSQNSIHVQYLVDVLNILMGNEDTILRYTNDDILALITTKIYKKDSIDKPIHEFAQSFFERHDSNDQSPHRFFLEGQLYQAIERSADYDWWFIVHLTDLLTKKNMLTQPLAYALEDGTHFKMNARDYFVLTYASYLNNEFNLWEQSFIYLMTCGELGKNVVLEHLKNMDFRNDDEKLNNVVKFCINYSMKNEGLVLYEKKAIVCLEMKNYCKALEYYNQAEKFQYLDQVFSAILQDFICTGNLYDIKLFENTSEFKGVHYVVYRDISYINQLFLKGEFRMAADIFNSLLKNVHIPNLLLPIVFAEGWKLLDKRSIFTLGELLELKNIWVKLNKSCNYQDFTWYHYYINRNSYSSMEETSIPEDDLLSDMAEFFNTTAIIITRAIDTLDK